MHFLTAERRKKGFPPLLQAVDGTKLQTRKVIACALKDISKTILEFIKKQEDEEYEISDVEWVLTVPAIWSHEAC